MTESEDRDPIEEIMNALRKFRDDRQPFELEYGDDYCADGFVVAIGDDFAILSRIHQRAWPNGFRAIRFSAIQKVSPTGDAKFIGRAMRALKQNVPPQIPFHPKKMAEFVASVCDHYPIVVMDDDPENDNPDGVAGTIQGVADGVIQLRAISTDGYWLEGIHTVPLQHVEHVLFGSNYEDTLQLIGELADA